MRLKVARLRESARLPTKVYDTDAGWDLYACIQCPVVYRPSDRMVAVPTGIALEIPEGYLGLVVARSSAGLAGVSFNVGVIDSDYRGEVMAIFHTTCPVTVCPGDRIAQLLIIRNENVRVEEVEREDLSPSVRGANGFGSTGK